MRQDQLVPTSVTLFDQGLVRVLQASVTGLQPKQPYVLALSHRPGHERPAEEFWVRRLLAFY